ncbi:hypothetical protein [Pelagibacterium halotolerans]|uniref:hypothetical protein n=1 Tax=Pelagibacterium halotolerans TaxID=531813 RepID=UPI0005A1A4F8|nr:hypothetical protein [Pelagibacterium halotolerans]QJR19116.1 hypothetical protein HKM20_12115 [Pelagibacterium halotolerans]SEA01968.1 hypothetical protein SAMN05428936_101879 [Pelagibacterium halotolerans]
MDYYDEGGHVKDTFAYFGRAYFMANAFEAGLAIASMILGFLAEEKAKLASGERKEFDQDQYEKDFDAYMARQHAQTLGNLIKNVSRFPALGNDFLSLLPEVKAKRDFLAHHFFRVRAVPFASRHGRDRMIQELRDMEEIFERADSMLTKLMKPHYLEIGLDESRSRAIQATLLREYAESNER